MATPCGEAHFGDLRRLSRSRFPGKDQHGAARDQIGYLTGTRADRKLWRKLDSKRSHGKTDKNADMTGKNPGMQLNSGIKQAHVRPNKSVRMSTPDCLIGKIEFYK
ncbi:hypothetical protein [Geminisphaera colitermitum]|uniref:hypothetical protein n=1 Tax=Geminisphaera colitermitum TaxID=1148786 RepID=UPI001E2BF90C|nr:hypothetical protein [Geminisphaera colitermitum]